MTAEQFGEYIRADVARWTAARARPQHPARLRDVTTRTTDGPQHPGRRRPQRTARSRRILARVRRRHPSRGWSDAVDHEAHRTFLNWVGCAVGAAHHEAAEAALAAVQALQPARAGDRARPRASASTWRAPRCSTASGSHTFDFDDTHLKTIIHPAGPVASAALALAEQHRRARAAR